MLLLSACSPDKTPLELRQDQAQARDANKSSPVVIGIAWEKEKEPINFVTSAQFAIDEWNKQCALENSNADKSESQKLKECGILWKRKIEIEFENEPWLDTNENMSEVERLQKEKDKTYEIARKFAKNLNVIAVIGHANSSQAIPASITYEQHGIVFLAPTATNLALTNHNFKYVFRLMPNNEELSAKMTDYLKDNNYKRIALLYERSIYGEEFAENFVKNSTNKLDIVFQQSFFPTDKRTDEDITEILADLRKKSFLLDAIFLITNDEKVCQVIKQARNLDIKKPFVGGDGVFWSDLKECQEAKGTVAPTILNKSKLENFKKDLKVIDDNKYEPVLLGYDAINLLIHAIIQAESTVPIEIAGQLRYMVPPWEGTLGRYAFKEDGNLKRENAVNLAILCPDPKNPQKLAFKISSDSSPKCEKELANNK